MFLFKGIGVALLIMFSLSVVLTADDNQIVSQAGNASESDEPYIERLDSLSVSQMLQADLQKGEAYIWYLLHSGFAVKTKSKLLIFDYIGTYLNKQDTASARSLSTGWINPEEIRNLDAYVFVSHAHPDHYDTTILSWRKELKDITYIFGWQAGDNENDHYLTDRRTSTVVDGMEIHTINSHHGGIPEVGYLVKVDGLTLYHSGDCRDDYVSEMNYLRGIVDGVDIAFQYDIDIDEPLREFVIHPLLALRPGVAFPMHWGDEEYKCRESCRRWQARGFTGICSCADRRGASFLFRKEGVGEDLDPGLKGPYEDIDR